MNRLPRALQTGRKEVRVLDVHIQGHATFVFLAGAHWIVAIVAQVRDGHFRNAGLAALPARGRDIDTKVQRFVGIVGILNSLFPL
jgi:hypothetical protein